jgi:hypothetical protein
VTGSLRAAASTVCGGHALPPVRYLPARIRDWPEVNKLSDCELKRDGRWLV